MFKELVASAAPRVGCFEGAGFLVIGPRVTGVGDAVEGSGGVVA